MFLIFSCFTIGYYSQDTTHIKNYNIIYTNILSSGFYDYSYNLETNTFPFCIGYKHGFLKNKYIFGIEGGVVVKNTNQKNENIKKTSGFYSNAEFQIKNKNSKNYLTFGYNIKYTNDTYILYDPLLMQDYYYEFPRVVHGLFIGYNKIFLLRRMYVEVGLGPILYYYSHLSNSNQFFYTEEDQSIRIRLKLTINIGFKI
ncbi:MAG: hypothetical protein AB1304_05365 [Bacteroidota bacterium]